MKLDYYLVYTLGTTIGIFCAIIHIYLVKQEKTYNINFNSTLKNQILNSNKLKNLIIDKNKNVGILFDIEYDKSKNMSVLKRSYEKISQQDYDKIRNARICTKIYSRIIYKGTHEKLHENIIKILENILLMLRTDNKSKQIKTLDSVNKEQIRIKENVKLVEDIDHMYLTLKNQTKISNPIGYISQMLKPQDKYFTDILSNNICILFNQEGNKQLILFLETVIYLMEQKNIVKYLTIKFNGKIINTFFMFLVDQNTLPFCKFTSIEQSIENFLKLHNIKFEDEIFVDGRKVFLINHVYKCLRLAFV